MKKRELKKWVRELIKMIIWLLILLFIFIVIRLSDFSFEKNAKDCDELYDRQCAYHEIIQMNRNKE